MFGRAGRKAATDFEPSTEVFPSIAVAPLAKSLKLEKRGREDGKQNFPAQTSTGPSRAEQEVVSAVSRLRKKGIDAFDTHFNAYQGRIDASRAAVETIEERAGKLRNEMISEGNSQHNKVMNALNDVGEQNGKLQAFRNKHRIVGPPRARKNGFLVFAIAFIGFSIEVVLGAVFFSERSPAGLIGGVNTALLISLINVAIGGVLGFGSRFSTLSGIGNKVLGYVSLLAFFIAALGFNFLVAHFRKALEEMPWEQAAAAVRESMIAAPFDLGNFNAIIIALFGFLVAVMAFIDIRIWQDPRPGYNAIYDDARDAIDDYADEYAEAKQTLDDLYQKSSEALQDEAHKLRGVVRGAATARSAQATLCANLDAFVEECEQVANGLLRVYREENERARSIQPPGHFTKLHRFPTHQRPEPANVAAARIDADIERIDAAAKQGVRDILAARKDQLDTLPKTEVLLRGLPDERMPDLPSAARLEVVAGARS